MSFVGWALVAGMLAAGAVQEEGTAPAPETLSAFDGCWEGSGHVMGKPVSTRLEISPVSLGAWKVFEASSVALGDASDRYEAHILVGGAASVENGLISYFADSFGGDYASAGKGRITTGGFEAEYGYASATFVNRWQVEGAKVVWTIHARNPTGEESEFATYALDRVACAAGE